MTVDILLNRKRMFRMIEIIVVVFALIVVECSGIGPSLSNTYSGRGRGRGRSWTYFGPAYVVFYIINAKMTHTYVTLEPQGV